MSKRVLSILSLLVIFSTVLAACATQATPIPTEPPPTQAPEPTKAPEPTAVPATPVTLKVWAPAGEVERYRVDGPVEAAKLVTDFDVTVDPLRDPGTVGDFGAKFVLAADAGEAPHIVCAGSENIPAWANAGYLVDFEQCKERYTEFDDVIDNLWNSPTWHGKVWGVPEDTEARPMFYNKTKLKELGWSDADIDGLPDKIMNGEFTLDDLIATAKEAVEKGVIDPGNGYWHRPQAGADQFQYYFSYGGRWYDEPEDKLVVTKSALRDWYSFQRRVVVEGITPENYIGTDWSIWHDTVAHGSILFWNGGIWNWADWAVNYVADLGGQDYLFGFIGYALQPSGVKGKPGNTLSHPMVYMITSPEASGDDYYDAACSLLAKTTTTEINTLQAVTSTHLGVLKSQSDYADYADDRLLSETLYMLDHAEYVPNHAMFGTYLGTIYTNMVKVQNGEVTPEQAVEDTVAALNVDIGDFLIVED
jgi:inositol-phosphate transport system substrate-binding protein